MYNRPTVLTDQGHGPGIPEMTAALSYIDLAVLSVIIILQITLMLEVCVVGLGALGTLYGFAIERSGKARVTAVCRSNYDIVKTRGIDIKSEKFGDFDAWKPSRVVASTADAADRQYDYIICAAKFVPDLIPTSSILGPLIHHAPAIYLIQNGIGVHEELIQLVPNTTIMSACAWTDATAIDGGRVVRHGLLDRVLIGIHWPTGPIDVARKAASQEHLDVLVDALKTGGCDVKRSDNIESSRWEKNLWNIGFSVTTTLTRSSVATLLTDKWVAVSYPMAKGFIQEAIDVASAIGLPMPETAIPSIEDTTFPVYAETYPPRGETPFTPMHYKPSMLVDFEAGNPMEIHGIVGGVVKRAREAGVPVPRLETAFATLLLLQEPLLLARTKKSV
ncbi:hypothetical protein K439DRAFT_1415972 [Ramaria rubella]|nr:hypothetical protein K439DRAFT_1415972 [Ramaria rubella]